MPKRRGVVLAFLTDEESNLKPVFGLSKEAQNFILTSFFRATNSQKEHLC